MPIEGMDVVHITNYLGYSIPHPQSLVTIYKENINNTCDITFEWQVYECGP